MSRDYPNKMYIDNDNKQKPVTRIILFYSNFCNECKKLFNELKPILPKLNNVSLICIDNRYADDNSVWHVRLPNGQETVIPPMINVVPSICVYPSNEIFNGGDILKYLKPSTANIQGERNRINNEPQPFDYTTDIGSFGTAFSEHSTKPEMVYMEEDQFASKLSKSVDQLMQERDLDTPNRHEGAPPLDMQLPSY